MATEEDVVPDSMWCYKDLEDRVELVFVKEVIKSDDAVGYSNHDGDVVSYWLAGNGIGFDCSDTMEDFLGFFALCEIVPKER